MPTTATATRPMPADAIRERNRVLDGLLGQVTAAAHTSDEARRDAETAGAKVAELERTHPHYVATGMADWGSTAVWLGLVPLVAGLDVVLDAPALGFMAGQLGYEGVDAAWVRFGVPVGIVGLEAGYNLWRARAANAWREGKGSAAEYTAITLGGVVAVAAFTALVVSGLVEQALGTMASEQSGATALGSWLLVAGLGGAALLAHAAMVFAPLDEAKGRAMFGIARWWNRSAQTSAQRRETRVTPRVVEAFGRYVRAIEAFTTAQPGLRLTWGPFTAVTREVINRELGEGTIPPPGQARANAAASGEADSQQAAPGGAAPTAEAPGATPPPAAGGAQPDAEDELHYYRDVLGRRQREDESGVRA